MKIEANTVAEYLDAIPPERKAVVEKLLLVIEENLPIGFEKTMQYNMPGFVVPHEKYPPGYHVNPELPLPFISIASQKNFVAVYHMGLYADEDLLAWFTSTYPEHSQRKLDMGKSCIRFKNVEHIPYDLLGELATMITVDGWIESYERAKP